MIWLRRTKELEQPPGGLELVEEAFHLVRRAPAGVLASYYVGSLPFILALLFFWGDMAQSAFAHGHCAPAALVVAALFVWMKTWQSIYAQALLARARGVDPHPLTARRLVHLAVTQAMTQTWGLIILPFALLTVLPFAWAYSLFQSLCVLGDTEGGERTRDLVGRAWAQATRWPAQNMMLVWLLSPFQVVAAAALFLVVTPVIAANAPEWSLPLLAIYAVLFTLALLPTSPFGIVVALNLAMLGMAIPELGRMLLGVDTLAGNPAALCMNTTFAALVCGLTYLVLDPFAKAAYALKCFYGESRTSGADLRAALAARRLSGNPGRLLCLLACLGAGFLFAPASDAAEVESPAAPDAGVGAPELPEPEGGPIDPEELDQAIDQVLEQREYAWRMPRVIADEEQGFLSTFVESVFDTLGSGIRAVLRTLDNFRQWLQGWMPKRKPSIQGGSLLWLGQGLTTLLYWLLIFVCVVALIVGLFWLWKVSPRRKAVEVESGPAVAPDIESEETTADQLPEDGWLAMADELLRKGEPRLAMRALFLASLAYLDRTGFIKVAKFKSNRDYARELRRRGHAEPDMLTAFRDTVTLFERVWYGTHPVTNDGLAQFRSNQQKIRIHE